MKAATTEFPDNQASLLHEEIAFWRDYIKYCQGRNSGAVPPRVYDALERAELKLMLVQETQDDWDELRQLEH